MKKRGLLGICILLALVLAIAGVLAVNQCTPVNPEARGTIRYQYGTVSFENPLTAEESRKLADILNRSTRYSSPLSGTPSCGFDENISLTVDGTTYALACDSCGTLWVCGTARYIGITDADRSVLEEMFTSRGGYFPCL